MSTNNKGFYEDLRKIIFQSSSNIIKYAPYLFFFKSENTVSQLSFQNYISVWDTNMFVCVKYWNDMKVTDICLLEQNTSQNNR